MDIGLKKIEINQAAGYEDQISRFQLHVILSFAFFKDVVHIDYKGLGFRASGIGLAG